MAEHILEPNEDVKLQDVETFPTSGQTAWSNLAKGVIPPTIPSLTRGVRGKAGETAAGDIYEKFEHLTLSEGESILEVKGWAYAEVGENNFRLWGREEAKAVTVTGPSVAAWRMINFGKLPLANLNEMVLHGQYTISGKSGNICYAMFLQVFTSLPEEARSRKPITILSNFLKR